MGTHEANDVNVRCQVVDMGILSRSGEEHFGSPWFHNHCNAEWGPTPFGSALGRFGSSAVRRGLARLGFRRMGEHFRLLANHP